MQLREMASATVEGVARTVQGVTRFAKLERVLAAVCLLIPAFLIWSDHGTIRPSISAYFDMEQAQVFYFPLTVAAMLFVVNGVVKEKRAYNWILGVLLAGVVLFNHLDFPVIHNISAVGFFGGNAVVMVWSPKCVPTFLPLSELDDSTFPPGRIGGSQELPPVEEMH